MEENRSGANLVKSEFSKLCVGLVELARGVVARPVLIKKHALGATKRARFLSDPSPAKPTRRQDCVEFLQIWFFWFSGGVANTETMSS